MPKVNHEILRWARETAGLERAEAARKLQIRDARGVKAADRLAALERGEMEPPRSTLARMAKQYRRPLLTFYMSGPPRADERTARFRTLFGDQPPGEYAVIDALLRDVNARQDLVRAVLEDEDEVEPLRFVGSMKMSDGEPAVRAALGSLLDMQAEAFHAEKDPGAAFNLLRAQIEANGVFVLLKGDLGSYHTAIDASVFRGFAIVDDLAPFVVVNDRDARSAWSFTLLHEVVHLILDESGMRIDVHNERNPGIERLCDDVAGEFLLPSERLDFLHPISAWERTSQIAERIGEFSRSMNLSRSMVVYRAFRAGLIDRGVYTSLDETFREQWVQERDGQRRRNRQSDGGPNYYVIRRHRVGRALIDFTREMMGTGTLSTTRAAKVLGVKPTQVGRMLSSGDIS